MSEINKILDNLRRQCSRREYCTSDVLKKAEKALEGDTEKARQIVSTLVEDRYVDDLRYASAYAREKSAISGWGEVKIRYMLSAKGISRDLISQALEEVDIQRADNRLVKRLENKYRALREDPQCRLKLLRFALGRGYSYDEVSGHIDALMKEDK